MSTDPLKRWTPVMTVEAALSPTSAPDGSASVSPNPATNPAAVRTPQSLDLSKADLSFPPVRQPTMSRRHTRRIANGPRLPAFQYEVTSRMYRFLWVTVLVLHSLCALSLGITGATQFYSLGSAMLPYLTLYGITADAFYLPPIGVGYFVACGLHAFSIATILFHSVRSQRDAFTSMQVMPRTITTPIIRIRRVSLSAISSVEFRTQSVLQRLPSPFVRACYRSWHSLTKLYEATDIRNECYYIIYITRTILQSLVHVYQLYNASLYLPQPRVNMAWVVLFVVNCWAVPLLTLVFRANRPRTRLLCVFLNLALDICALVVFMWVIAYPYAVSFDLKATNFSRRLWYTDVWFIRMVNEVRVISVIGPLDFVAKMAVAFNVWRSLSVIPTMLKKVNKNEVVPTPQEPTGKSSETPPPPTQTQIPVELSVGGCGSVLGSLVLLLLGAGVLAAHLKATSWRPQRHCSLPVEAWFVSKPACSFLEYRCVDPNLTGSEQELTEFFRAFEPSLVSYVSIRFCSHVEFPRELRDFRNLLGIKLYNSTLVSWDKRAAITANHHPDLRFVYFIDVDMVEFPRALLSEDFPRRLFDVEICQTNLTSLPDDLDQFWPKQFMTFSLEASPFTELPPVVARLQLAALSLTRSRLTSVAAEIFENPALSYIMLNENPLQELPSNVTADPRFQWLTVEQTLLTSMPSAYATVKVSAHGTPLCDAPSPLPSHVDCTRSDPIDAMMYPIDFEELLNGAPPKTRVMVV